MGRDVPNALLIHSSQVEREEEGAVPLAEVDVVIVVYHVFA